MIEWIQVNSNKRLILKSLLSKRYTEDSENYYRKDFSTMLFF